MIFEETDFCGCYIILPEVHGDSRGWFARTYCKNEFAQINHTQEWVQMNHSYSATKGTLRGMHFQKYPHSEIKLVRCISGAIYDVIVDLRKDSETYLKWLGVELNAQNKKQLYIPEGFAHGFQTLTQDAEVIYLHSKYYAKDSEEGLRYNDPLLNIVWPLTISEVSARDLKHPLLDIPIP